MKFETVSPREAVGARLAHSVAGAGRRWRKGLDVTAETALALTEAGVVSVVVTRLEAGDVGEDEAARRIAEAMAGEGLRVETPFTGRCNLFATQDGVLVVDEARVDAVNSIDEAATAATAPAYAAVRAGEMVATVKIIPFAAPLVAVEAARAEASGALRVAPWRVARVGVVATLTEGFKPSIAAKTARVLAERLAPAGARIATEKRVAHRAEEVAVALREISAESDLVVIFGASAIADRRDVVPAGLERAGGEVVRLGMPVDPGNLLMLGRLGDLPVIGAPGCARSPAENGFDWVLRRLLAGLPVNSDDIRRMGVGGLLSEIATRPQPREGHESQP